MRNCLCVGVNDLSRSRSAVQAHSAECGGVRGEVRGNLGITLQSRAWESAKRHIYCIPDFAAAIFFLFWLRTTAQLWCLSYLRPPPNPPTTSQQPPPQQIVTHGLFVCSQGIIANNTANGDHLLFAAAAATDPRDGGSEVRILIWRLRKVLTGPIYNMIILESPAH